MKHTAVLCLTMAILIGCGGGGGGGETKSSANRSTPGDVKANEWISIDGGSYKAGDNRFDNFPLKGYKVPGYEIQKFEVTNHQYKTWLDTLTPELREEHTPKEHFTKKAAWVDGWYPEGAHNHPVVNITYKNAKAYAEGNGWKLPTRVQWEVAARGTDLKAFPWGDSFVTANGHIGGSDLKDVGSYDAGKSWCGTYDQTGNAWEFTQSSYDKTNRAKLLKGGSYMEKEELFFLSANNLSAPLGDFNPNWGFRCAR